MKIDNWLDKFKFWLLLEIEKEIEKIECTLTKELQKWKFRKDRNMKECDRINIEQMVKDILIALDEERGIFFCMSSPDCLECEPVSMDFAIASMTNYILYYLKSRKD